MLRRSACGIKRSVFAAVSAQAAAGGRGKAAATSAPAKRVGAGMRAFGWPGIDPPVLLFSASELTRSEGKAKTPAKSIRRVASQGPCRMRLGRRPKMRAPWRKRTELLEDRLARASHGQG